MRPNLTTAWITALLILTGATGLQAAGTSVSELGDAMANVKEKGYIILAPENFRQADRKLEEALRQEKNNRAQEAERAAKAGLQFLQQGQQYANQSMAVLQEALAVRDKAIEAGAPDYFRDRFNAADQELENATRAVEKGRSEEAKKRQPDLMKIFSELEIEALKKGTVDLAKSKIEQAKQDGAGGEAPKTLKLAETELTLALSVLEADRTNTKKADAHANRAIRLAGTAQEITELSKAFKHDNFKIEDIILWHQDQLQAIFRSLDPDIRFDQPPRTLESNLKKSVDALIENQAVTGKLLEKKQAEIAELEAKLDQQLSEAKQAQLLEQRNKQRFTDVQTQFSEEEAVVYRKGDDVLISAHGFYFPVGGYQISTSNYALLNKFVSAIRQFPGSRVRISGHTDATGNPDKNLSLSIKRAESVAQFLSEVGEIEASRITAQGFGDTKPVASNKTVEGRSQNRRIEVYIENRQ